MKQKGRTHKTKNSSVQNALAYTWVHNGPVHWNYKAYFGTLSRSNFKRFKAT